MTMSAALPHGYRRLRRFLFGIHDSHCAAAYEVISTVIASKVIAARSFALDGS